MVKALAGTLGDFTEAPQFEARLEFLKTSQWWPQEKLKAHQRTALKEVLTVASTRVPFYRDFFKKNGLSVDQFKETSDLKKLPLINKEMIKKSPDQFLVDDKDKADFFTRTTGGSTGEPLTIYFDRETKINDLANTFYYMDVAGFDPRVDRSIRLYGDRIEVKDGSYWKEENERKVIFSALHISSETIAAYVEKINQLKPNYIHGRPSAVVPLCEEIKRAQLKIKEAVPCIFLDGEVLPKSQRDLIETVFNGRVYMTYGHTEGALLGFSCASSRNLHMAPQVGIVELLTPDGASVVQEGEKGEVVVTGFNNHVFPLIRYQTGDIGTLAASPCACKREFLTLSQLEGRIDDHVVGKSGKVVSLTPIVFNYNGVDWSDVKRFQVEQSSVGKLQVNIVPLNQNLEKSVLERIFTQLSSLLQDEFQVEVKSVKEIERTNRGKYRYLNQKLKMNNYFRAHA